MTEATIRQLEAALREAQLHADVAALDELIDDALLFTGPDGKLTTKADDLALHRSGVVRITSHEPHDLQWRVVSDDVVVVAHRRRPCECSTVGKSRSRGRRRCMIQQKSNAQCRGNLIECYAECYAPRQIRLRDCYHWPNRRRRLQ